MVDGISRGPIDNSDLEAGRPGGISAIEGLARSRVFCWESVRGRAAYVFGPLMILTGEVGTPLARSAAGWVLDDDKRASCCFLSD